MNPRTLLAAALVLAIALTAYLSRNVGPGANAAPAPSVATERPSADVALVAPDLPVRAAVSSAAEPATAVADPVDAAPGHVQDALVARSGALIAGLALDPNDAPLVAAEIWLVAENEDEQPVFGPWVGPFEATSARTDADGRFQFADVDPGTWWVGPAMVDDAASAVGTDVMLPLAETVVIAPGQARADVTLRCQAGLWIRGRVVDPDGAPVAEAYVSAWSPTISLSASAHAAAGGSFTVGPFSPGACQLEALSFSGAAGHAPSQVVDAPAGATDVELRLQRGGTLGGKIVDRATGRVLAGSVTVMRSGERELGRSWYATVGSDGSADAGFTFARLPPGDYDLMAAAEGERIGVLGAIAVEAGAEIAGLRVEVVPGGLVYVRANPKCSKCRVRATSGGALLGMLGSPRYDQERMAYAAPEGPALFELLGPDGALLAQRQVEVRAGEPQEVVFE